MQTLNQSQYSEWSSLTRWKANKHRLLFFSWKKTFSEKRKYGNKKKYIPGKKGNEQEHKTTNFWDE